MPTHHIFHNTPHGAVVYNVTHGGIPTAAIYPTLHGKHCAPGTRKQFHQRPTCAAENARDKWVEETLAAMHKRAISV